MRFTIRDKIIMLALAAIAVTGLCSGIFIQQTVANIRQEVFDNQTAVGKSYATAVREYLNGAQHDVETLARTPAMHAPVDTNQIQPELYGIPAGADSLRRASAAALIDDSHAILTVMSAAPDGQVYFFEPYQKQIAAHLKNIRGAQPSIADRTLATRATTWSGVILDRWSGEPTVVIQVPVLDDNGQVLSLIGASISLARLEEVADTIHPTSASTVMLFDAAGVPIVYPDPARITAQQPLVEMPLVSKALSGDYGSFAYHNDLTNADELGTVVPLENGWYAAVTRPQAEAFAGLRNTIGVMLAVLIASVVALLIDGVALARLIERNLHIVASAANGLACGDLEQTVDVYSNDEVGQMASAFRRAMAYQQHMAAIADSVAVGDLDVLVEPHSERDRLGTALRNMIDNLREQVHERQQFESALRVRDRAIAAATNAIVIIGRESDGSPGHIVYANPAFELLTGYSTDETIGQSLMLLKHPDTDPRTIGQLFGALMEGREVEVNLMGRRKDGSAVWTEVTVAPVRDDSGEITHFVHVFTDTTARVELEKQTAALARSEKLRALGQMASGIAHDLNQSLMLIASYGELGRRATAAASIDVEELRETLTVIIQAALTGGETVKQLLQFARAPADERSEPVDLTTLAREVVQLTAPHWRDAPQGEGRPIELILDTVGHPVVEASPARIRESLTNLILNAADALPTGGTIKVHVRLDGNLGIVEVIDNGIGMPPEVQSRIFEPFYTTKGDKGSGLGLATVFGIVEHLDGKLHVDSQVGQGTRFRLELAATAPAAPVPPARPAATPSLEGPRQLRILAVDDEPALTKAVVRLLRPFGHVVKVANSGEEALECLREQEFDVVLSDIGMGAGMNGWELAQHVKESWPAVRFALATGWGAGIDEADARARGIVAVLAKPYSVADLEQVLAAA